jgi:hypothetical protein
MASLFHFNMYDTLYNIVDFKSLYILFSHQNRGTLEGTCSLTQCWPTFLHDQAALHFKLGSLGSLHSPVLLQHPSWFAIGADSELGLLCVAIGAQPPASRISHGTSCRRIATM